MSFDQYHHGVRVVETAIDTPPIRTNNPSIIGIVATADDADNKTFPLNRNVLVNNVRGVIGDAGTSGTLAYTLDAIATQTSPLIVVHRVADDADRAALATNVIGSDVDGVKTGLQALLATGNLGVTPSIIGIPGLESEATTLALASIVDEMDAFAYAAIPDSEASSKEQANAYRNKFANRELMLLWPDAQNYRNGELTTIAASAYALGMRAKIDSEIGWHKSLSNRPINGIAGINKDVSWSLTKTTTDANYLNERDITTLIQSNGLRFWGNRNCAGKNSHYRFEVTTRTAQVLKKTIADAHLPFSDRALTPGLIGDILIRVEAKGREFVSSGKLLGFDAWFDSTQNTKELLASGKARVSYKYTAVPPLEDLQFVQSITDEYFIDFASRINS